MDEIHADNQYEHCSCVSQNNILSAVIKALGYSKALRFHSWYKYEFQIISFVSRTWDFIFISKDKQMWLTAGQPCGYS
jgi:hypothetical protein